MFYLEKLYVLPAFSQHLLEGSEIVLQNIIQLNLVTLKNGLNFLNFDKT
jgi:hypothetical protein